MIVDPDQIPVRTTSMYPEQFKLLMVGRSKQSLGDAAGIKNYGVNLVKLAPGSCSSVRHWHTKQDEFIYVIEGEITLVTDAGEQTLKPGMAAGFPAGVDNGHNLINRSNSIAVYLEVGARTPADEVYYPDVDLAAKYTANGWVFTHKDGSLYPKT